MFDQGKEPTMNTYTDNAAGARQCLMDNVEPKLAQYVADRLDSGEFLIERDEVQGTLVLRGDYRTLAIFWLDSADVEFNDALLEKVYS